MATRLIRYCLALSIFLSVLLPGPLAPAVEASNIDHSGGGLTTSRVDQQGVAFTWTLPAFELAALTLVDQEYLTIDLPGSISSGVAGSPQVPVFRRLIGLPAGAVVDIQVVPGKSREISLDLPLVPGASASPLETDLQAGELVYLPNLEVYAQETAFPGQLARVVSEGWAADRRLALIEIAPFQVYPADQKLLVYETLTIEIRFLDETGKNPLWSLANPEVSGGLGLDTLASQVVNESVARFWRAEPTGISPRLHLPAASLDDTWARLVVTQEGLYRVTYAELLAQGVDFGGVDVDLLHLTNLGDPVAVQVEDGGDGIFNTGDSLLFFGQAFDGDRYAEKYPDPFLYYIYDYTDTTNYPGFGYPADVLNYQRDAGLHHEKYTDENIYWLTVGTQPGLRMASIPAAPGGAPLAATFTETMRTETSDYWWTWHFTQEDTWFTDRIVYAGSTVITRTYTVELSGVASGAHTATLSANLVARSFDNLTDPDHSARLGLSGYTGIVDDSAWDGRRRELLQGEVPQSALVSGANGVQLGVRKVTGVTLQEIWLDWVEIQYQRLFQAEANQLNFGSPAAGTWRYQVGNLTDAAVHLLQIENSLEPVILTAGVVSGSGPYTLEFQSNANRYYAAGESAVLPVESISPYMADDLLDPANGADYIFIAHSNFLAATQALADYRAGQGLRTRVVDIQDVYNQFGGGIFNPLAIRNFLAYAYANWSGAAPTYALLVGDGHWNFFGNATATYGQPRAITMPPYLMWGDPWQGEVDSSSLLAAFVGTDLLPDMQIGRAVVETNAQMQAVVNKIIAFESAPAADWQTRASFVADNTDGGGAFSAEANAIIADHIPPYFAVDRLYLEDYFAPPANCAVNTPCPELTAALTNTINLTGTLFMNYVGHGADERWGAEELLHLKHVEDFSNPGMLPVSLDMTCLTGYWYHAQTEDPTKVDKTSLPAELLRKDAAGIVAAYAPTGLGVGTGHSVLHEGFYDGLFVDGDTTLGAAVNSSRLALFATAFNFDLLATFTILGDPALRLPVAVTYQPELQVSFLSYQNTGLETLQYSLEITNQGAMTDTIGFEIDPAPWDVTVTPEMIPDLPPGETATALLTISVPSNFPAGTQDTLTLHAFSYGNTAIYTSQTLSLLQFSVVSGPLTLSGQPGAILTYSLSIANTGALADRYEIEVGGAWLPVRPIETGWVAPNLTAPVQFTVTVPLDAEPDDSALTFVSIHSVQGTGEAEFTYTSLALAPPPEYPIFLPLARKAAP